MGESRVFKKEVAHGKKKRWVQWKKKSLAMKEGAHMPSLVEYSNNGKVSCKSTMDLSSIWTHILTITNKDTNSRYIE